MVNKYLFLAFSALWVIFFLYSWSLSRRQAHLRKELGELKNRAGRGRLSDSQPS
jgi:CcmD family protein